MMANSQHKLPYMPEYIYIYDEQQVRDSLGFSRILAGFCDVQRFELQVEASTERKGCFL